MLRPGGYALVLDPDAKGGVALERDTFSCSHCQRVVFVTPFAAASECGGWCGNCAKPVCGDCADRGVCVPWERVMERIEARDRFLRSAGLG